MRAGWGIAIFAIFIVIFIVVGGVVGLGASGQLKSVMAQRMAHPHTPLHIDFDSALVIGNDGANFFGLLAVCWFFSRAERRPLSAYGLASNRRFDFLPGFVCGLSAMSLLVFLLHGLHLLAFDGRALFGISILSFGLKWLIAFLFVGLSEEYTFRGYIQYTLMRGFWGLAEKVSPTNPRAWAFWIAAIFWSLGFGLAHVSNKGETFIGILQVVLAGLTFSYALWRTGSLWWAIGLHASWDWAQSFLFGVADSGNVSVGRLFITHPTGRSILSGGTDGPEGSLLAVPILLAVIAVIHLATRPGPQPAIEQMPLAPEPVAP